ncbi:hypothetical protein [Vibrio parahaemolyticus]|uniref:hypothetical protein n=1 Tax=Vibrio parahaemolyticus TaxID=670 RepID=UPI00235DFCBC|nr:hypothetical protein [Vibrio parahaemolyticus]
MSKTIRYLDSCTDQLPQYLPIVHVTTKRKLASILKNGRIDLGPKCKVINQRVLFFNYGGAYYRINDDMGPREQPVALMYKASILNEADKFVPYDTGAVNKNLYGPWCLEMGKFKKYSFKLGQPELPRKFIKIMFNTNKNYLSGKVIPLKDNAPTKLKNLYKFYIEPQTSMGNRLDPRRHILEVHFSKPVDLSSDIIWIALPKSSVEYADKIQTYVGEMNPLHIYFYEEEECWPADQICSWIHHEAREHLKKFYGLDV